MESRTQGSRPRPRTQKKSEAKASLSEDRHTRGQGQECSRPRTKDTSASALQIKKKRSSQKRSPKKKKKKKASQKFCRRSPQKNVFQKIFQALHKILTIQKILLSVSALLFRESHNADGAWLSFSRIDFNKLHTRT